MELVTKCAKICPCKNVTDGLMHEKLAARKYVRSQYLHVKRGVVWPYKENHARIFHISLKKMLNIKRT